MSATALAIRPAEEKDLADILGIYERARRFMRATGNPCQWGNIHPPEALIREDIRLRRNYVCVGEGGEILGVFVYLFGENPEPGYDRPDVRWAKKGPYGVVHRIAVKKSGLGVGEYCLNRALAQCGYLRIDTHPDNHVMQSLLTKLGFEKRGVITIEDDGVEGDLLIRFAYDKVLGTDTSAAGLQSERNKQ